MEGLNLAFHRTMEIGFIRGFKVGMDNIHLSHFIYADDASLISSGGRLTLVKSVMGSLGIYLMSLFKCPETVLKRLESIRAIFFWGGSNSVKKMSWLKWDKVLASFDKGGLNVGSLKAFNLALLFKWRWRDIVGGRIEQYLKVLLEEIGCPILRDRPDSWVCNLSDDGSYMVKDAREYCILVRWNLSAKGIDIDSIVYPNCNNGVETRDHLFFDCDVARDLWLRIRIWLGCGLPHFSSWDLFVVWLEGVRLTVSSKNRIIAVMVTSLWAIWRFRNDVVFQDSFCSKNSLFDVIRLFSFHWIKNRGHLVSNWNFWLSMPV
ncbi:uncharacterized protein [Rutidosis leptorrhynchoides]|uniref:uncharacterized protein n=1 Tax=Rutidosis leptorrhynchoides TaxID=125765 RepID=UPI003A99DF36